MAPSDHALTVLTIVGSMMLVQLVLLTVAIGRLGSEVRALRNDKRQQVLSDRWRCVTSR